MLMLSKKKRLIIAFLGPDGSGKTTVKAGVVDEIKTNFVDVQEYHLRSFFGRSFQSKINVTDPHGNKNRGWITSNLKLIYFLLDYYFAFFFLFKKGNLIIFDRYYHDLLIDSKRYRFGGSYFFANLLSKVVPEPDIYFILTADPELIRKRKQEVSVDEIKRQIKRYQRFSETNSRAVLIDTSKNAKTSVAEVLNAIDL